MAKQDKTLPSGIGGLTRYDVESKGMKIRPEEVAGIVAVVLALEVALYYLRPI